MAIAHGTAVEAAPVADDPDTPLREETRLLGRLLGEVLRTSIGEDGYQRIETIRARAVQQRRDVLRVLRVQGVARVEEPGFGHP